MARSKNSRPINEGGRFAVECPEINDEAWLRHAYEVEGKTQQAIADELGITVGWVKVKFRQFGIKGRPPKVRNAESKRTPEERMRIGLPPEMKPTAERRSLRHNGKNVRRARVVAEEKLGRPLLPGETVHHIDGNSLNDAPENIRVFPSNAAHARFHWKIWKSRRL